MIKSVLQAAHNLDGGYFAFVMATGIVSIAAFQQHMETTALVLFGLNNFAYLVLIVLTLLRCTAYPEKVFIDMSTPARAPALFTITAGTCILGSQYVILANIYSAATGLLVAGLFFWAVLIYTFFAAVIVATGKTFFEEGLNGGWLIYVVGTQAAAILSVLVGANARSHFLLLLSAGLHGCGNILYVVMIVFVLRRLMFLDISRENLTQHYWISMGAAAVSTLAGAQVMLHAGSWTFFQEMLPALMWVTFAFWSLTTWWIPLIVILVVWRFGAKRFPVAYDVQHWSMVFPLGMYTVCSFQLGRAAGLEPLSRIAGYFLYLALAAWAAAFIGMLGTFIAGLPGRNR